MSASKRRVPLPGSERAALPSARAVGAADPKERIKVTVVLRSRTTGEGVAAALSAQPPQAPQYLSRAELAAARGAAPEDVAQVEDFARAHDLEVVATNSARRSVVLAGTVAAFNAAFGVELQQYDHPGGAYRGRTGAIHVPEALAPIVQAVLGLDDRPQAAPHFRILQPTAEAAQPAVNSAFTPLDLAQLYTFPAGLDGTGQTIGIIELGGGYRQTELKTYFTQLGITPPKVISVAVDHGRNRPTHNPNSADGEVMLDIEVASWMAPGARVVVYFAPNTDRGFLDAITTAIHEQRHTPSVISISWGAPESGWTAQAMQAFDQAFQDAAALGVTVCCASGDNGSSDGASDGKAHVDFPAASPMRSPVAARGSMPRAVQSRARPSGMMAQAADPPAVA